MVNYRFLSPREGEVFVDHESAGRSGHMSHALVEYAPGRVLAFYSNCSLNRNKGHNGFGWIETRRSVDGARTWSEAEKVPYTWNAFMNDPFTVSIEKAVVTGENQIVAFCTRNTNPNGWEPYLTPTVIRSSDGGFTWSEAKEMCAVRGRIYDAFFSDGEIFAFMQANSDFLGTDPSHVYEIYRSADGGETFEKVSQLPGNAIGHAYGALKKRDDGSLIAYTYNSGDEFNLDWFVSRDMGKTWTESGKSFCAKRIRNPQIARVRGGYVLHGRSGAGSFVLPMNFVFYTSEDGIHWDEGMYLHEVRPGASTAYYSNNLILNDPDGSQRLLIQSSVAYREARTNIYHWMLEML